MLLGYKFCSQYASQIADQLKDSNVNGQAIDTLIKMQSSDYVPQVIPFMTDKTTWIKNKAKKYVEKYGGY